MTANACVSFFFFLICTAPVPIDLTDNTNVDDIPIRRSTRQSLKRSRSRSAASSDAPLVQLASEKTLKKNTKKKKRARSKDSKFLPKSKKPKLRPKSVPAKNGDRESNDKKSTSRRHAGLQRKVRGRPSTVRVVCVFCISLSEQVDTFQRYFFLACKCRYPHPPSPGTHPVNSLRLRG